MTADEFKKRYLIYHRRLYQLAYVLTSNPHDAEDLLQDLYLKMWKMRDRITEINNPEGFMATVMRRLYCDIRRAKEDDHLQFSCVQDRDIIAPHDVEQQIELQELETELMDYISSLPPKEQKVIRLYVLEDRNYKEIGAHTGLSPGSIRILVMRAKNKIKKRFNNKSKI